MKTLPPPAPTLAAIVRDRIQKLEITMLSRYSTTTEVEMARFMRAELLRMLEAAGEKPPPPVLKLATQDDGRR